MPDKILLLLLFISTVAYSQKIALLDRSFKEPVSYTDSLTVGMMEKGAFPLYVKDADKLITLMDWFLKNMNSTHPEAIPTQVMQWRNSELFIYTRHEGHYIKYQLVVKTILTHCSTSLVLIDEKDPFPVALEKLNRISDYIRNNLALLKKEATPNP